MPEADASVLPQAVKQGLKQGMLQSVRRTLTF